MALSTLPTPVAPHVAVPNESTGRRRLYWGSGLLTLFLILTVCTSLHAFDSFDASLDGRFHTFALTHSAVVAVTKVVTLLGEPPVGLGGGLVLAVIFYLKRRQQAAYFFAAASIGGYAIAYLFKLLIDRQRPVWPVPVVPDTGPSYPSGHATGSAALATMIIVGVVPLMAAAVWRRVVVGLLLLYATLMPVSRLVLGVHLPTDVVAGMLLGTGWTLLVAAFLLLPPCRRIERA